MCATKHKPVLSDPLNVDFDARRARLEVLGFVRSIGEPIRNPLTGAEHRVGIDFPRSFEGSGTSKTSGSLRIPI
jgi:hypothetical protein